MIFSVIIRCKNEDQWIGHSIQSVIDILPIHTEIIIIDNNSNDDSKNIINMFINEKTNDITLKYFNIDNYSPGKAINLGVKNCSYENIMILSSHCVLTKINLNKIENLLQENVAIWGKQIPIYKGKKINRKRYIWKNFEDKDNINYYSDGEDRYFLHNALSIYKKSILEKYIKDEKLVGKEDRYWAIDRINEGHNIYYDSELECNHYYTNNGATWKSI
jgi:rhamnosyltransferase